MAIIALSGWKRSGKDTVADYLTKTYNFKRLAFADPLKNNVAKDYGLDRASIDDPALKEAPILTMPVDPKDDFSRMIVKFMYKEFRSEDGSQPVNLVWLGGTVLGEMPGNKAPEVIYWTRRALCILEGSTKRAPDSNYWVTKAISQAEDGGLYVISDARYRNEMNVLKTVGGNSVVTVRIERFANSPSNDPSERDLDDYKFDYVLDNKEGGTLENLFDQVDQIVTTKFIRLRGGFGP